MTDDVTIRLDDAQTADELATGDAIRLPSDDVLVVAGVLPADETPDHTPDGPLYEVERRRVGGDRDRSLYGPHNIKNGLEAGAEFDGTREVDEADPFYCEGCGYPHRGAERYTAALADVDVCSYGCEQAVETDRRKERVADREGDA